MSRAASESLPELFFWTRDPLRNSPYNGRKCGVRSTASGQKRIEKTAQSTNQTTRFYQFPGIHPHCALSQGFCNPNFGNPAVLFRKTCTPRNIEIRPWRMVTGIGNSFLLVICNPLAHLNDPVLITVRFSFPQLRSIEKRPWLMFTPLTNHFYWCYAMK